MTSSFSGPDDRPRVALIAGPTASGKSGLALALAHNIRATGGDAVIINADASQVYADLAILSARPTPTEMGDIPHRLFGHIDGAADYHTARWAEEARREIALAHAEGAIPILVGGTGMYLTSLLHGIAPVPPIDEAIRAAVRALATEDAYARLQTIDPHGAARLEPRDKTRIARALEVVESSGSPLHVWQQRRTGGILPAIALAPIILTPPREPLRGRCDARLVTMFAGGAMAEVEALLARQLSPDLPVMRAIGVPQIAALLSGTIDTAEALLRTQIATHQYAKRQYTWFRNQMPDDWPRHEKLLNNDEATEIIIKLQNMILTA